MFLTIDVSDDATPSHSRFGEDTASDAINRKKCSP
jgi:hypothetical protein